MNEPILLKIGLGPSLSVGDLLPVQFPVPEAKRQKNPKEPQHLSFSIPATAEPLAWHLPQEWPRGKQPVSESRFPLPPAL